jgi:hypothetical protein
MNDERTVIAFTITWLTLALCKIDPKGDPGYIGINPNGTSHDTFSKACPKMDKIR